MVSRHFCAADGLPAEIDSLDWKVRHAVGMFFPAMIELQKQYARDLLTYRAADARRGLAADPSVAFVEINNENGLLQQWLSGNFDRLPAPFAEELSRQWNAWLKGHYKSTGDTAHGLGGKARHLGGSC